MRTRTFTFATLAAVLMAASIAVSPHEACGQVVHVVIATDDLDAKIGPSVHQDAILVETVFFTGITPGNLNIVRIPAETLDQDAILAALEAPNRRRVGPNDALVFFYSGHGGNDRGPGPYLSIPRLNRSIPRDVIERAVRRSGARLGVMLTDCCNSLAPIQPGELFPTPGGAMFITPVMRALFFECAGFVDITSSKRGEVSMCKKDFRKGGLFTNHLLEFLQKNSNRSATWRQLVAQVREGVADEFERDFGSTTVEIPDGRQVVQRTQTVTALALELRRAGGGMGNGPPRRFGAFIQDHGGDGVMVTSITSGSPASRIFLKELGVYGYMIPGDVILEANGRPIRGVEDFLEAVRNSGDTLEGRVRDPRDGRVSTFRADLSPGF